MFVGGGACPIHKFGCSEFSNSNMIFQIPSDQKKVDFMPDILSFEFPLHA